MTTLIVLDDDSIFHQIIDYAHANTDSYSHIHHYYKAEQLLDYLRQHKDESDKLPDVIFVDINLPIVDGWTFLSEYDILADSLSKKITIYVVTTSVRKEDRAQAGSYPFVEEYLIKPVTIDKLKAIAQKAKEI